jgi:BetR domain
MNQPVTIQETLFHTIKNQMPAHLSLVHEISELLGVSNDSAYRRIRGEKELSLEEFRALCSHFNISADLLFNIKTGNMIFSTMFIGPGGLDFDTWLKNILGEVRMVHPCKEKKVIYAAKDIPLFHYFDFPEILAFKVFFWHKALFGSGGFEEKSFSFDLADPYLSMGKEIMAYYHKICTIELWNEETITSIIRQIEFCHVSGFFHTKEDAVRLCDALVSWLRHVQHQADLGYRFMYGSPQEGTPGSYQIYYNEILISDNVIFVEADGQCTTHLTYNIINLLITSNPIFCEQVRSTLEILMQKGTLISGTSAKERSRFFNILVEKVHLLREKIMK